MSLPETKLWAITGATGYIGRALIERLTADRQHVRMLAGDIREGDAIRRLVEGAGIVVHLAAWVHRGADERQAWSVNVDGTRALAEGVAEAAPQAFVIFLSSASVYGESENVLDEQASCHPNTAYGRSKLAAERVLLDSKLRVAILRPAMVFGPDAPGNLRRLAHMVRSRVVIEVGHGRQRKSILPIATLIDAIMAVAIAQPAGEIFNVAGGEPLTMREITHVLSGSRRVIRVPVPARLVPDRFRAYATSAVLDDTKLRRMTRYAPRLSPREALATFTL